MTRMHHLLGACLLMVFVQTGSAAGWWWPRKDCPQQESCPVTCHSGYVALEDHRGCTIQLCKCKDVCEYHTCPENTRCQKRFHCKTWGGCFVYPRCVVSRDVGLTQAPGNVQTDAPTATTRRRTTATTAVPTSHSTTTTTAATTTPTRRPTTTAGGEVISQKTISANLCPGGEQHLQGWNCDLTLLRGRPCPTSYRCETGSSGSFAVCCPAPITQRAPTSKAPTTQKVEQVTQGSVPETFCKDGQPHLAELNCGRGGQRCPSNHTCLIHPADQYAVCCPDPIMKDQPSVPIAGQGLPMCEQQLKVGSCKSNLPRWYFNSKTGLCEFFRFGVCDENANNFKSIETCERACGKPEESYCSFKPEKGRCRAAFRRYHFDSTTNECTKFIYGGCDGNGNNFVTVEQCERFCFSIYIPVASQRSLA